MRARKEWLNWFRVDRDLPDHPKLLQLAAGLGIHPERAVGRLVRFWAWVARFAPEGRLRGAQIHALRGLLGEAAGLAGPLLGPDPTLPFIDAGFLERGHDELIVHDWAAMNGTQLRERQRDRRRLEERTSIPAVNPRDCHGNAAGTERNGTNTEQDESKDLAPSRGGSRPKEPAIVSLPAISGKIVPITASELEAWRIAFPAVNVTAELARMHAWLLSNPKLGKTASGMKRFVNNWLSRAQDRARPEQFVKGIRSGADARYADSNPSAKGD